MQCCTASIDRSSQRHRVTGHWRRPSLCLFPSLPLSSHSVSLSLSLSHILSVATSPFHRPILRSPTRSLFLFLSLCLTLFRFVSFLPSACARSVSFCVFGPELSEFHFRPITIHPRFKAAVTPRSFRKRVAPPEAIVSFLPRTCRIYSPVTPQPFVFFFVFVWSVR